LTRYQLDARRLFCPMPVIRVQDRVAQLAPGDELEVVCSDHGALNDVPAWCRINGHTVLETRDTGAEVYIVVQVGSGDAS